MTRRVRAGLIAALIVAAAAAAIFFLEPWIELAFAPDPWRGPTARERLQDLVDRFDAVDTAGNRWTRERMDGRVVLIDFWATWCGPCVKELPHLAQVYELYHDEGFEIVGVSLDSGSQADFEAWTERHGVSWPQIFEGRGFTSSLALRFGVKSIPRSLLLDRDGRVAAVNLRGARLVEAVGRQVRGAR